MLTGDVFPGFLRCSVQFTSGPDLVPIGSAEIRQRCSDPPRRGFYLPLYFLISILRPFPGPYSVAGPCIGKHQDRQIIGPHAQNIVPISACKNQLEKSQFPIILLANPAFSRFWMEFFWIFSISEIFWPKIFESLQIPESRYSRWIFWKFASESRWSRWRFIKCEKVQKSLIFAKVAGILRDQKVAEFFRFFSLFIRFRSAVGWIFQPQKRDSPFYWTAMHL